MAIIKAIEEIISDKGYNVAYNNTFTYTNEEEKLMSAIPSELHCNILVYLFIYLAQCIILKLLRRVLEIGNII
jgi:hypothetical protein